MKMIVSCVVMFVGMLLGTSAVMAAAADDGLEDQMKVLMSRLNLDYPGLEEVKAAGDDYQKAAELLLAYYRHREGVIHTEVNRGEREGARGKFASARDIEIADDAVRNVLLATPNYPRHDFGEKIDWFTNRNPQGDQEWIVQLHRQYSWGHMGKAYWHTGDEKYAKAYCRQLEDWIRNCPRNDGWPAWRVLEVGIRGHSWTGHFNRFLDSEHFTAEVLVRQLNSFYEHADCLTRDRELSSNNWGLMEAEGAAFIGVIFPEFKEAEKWRSKSFAYLAGQIDRQVLDDGMHYEMCFGYHAGSIRWFDRTRQLAEANGYGEGFGADYVKTIERMYEVLGRCAHPNWRTSMFGDDRPSYVTSTVRKGSEMFGENEELRFLATQGREGRTPGLTYALPSAGIYSLRSGWDDQAIHFLMKCGKDGGWHCQPDNGTFELYAYGRYLMPDSGCYIYSGDKSGRQWFRQTKVHQTLTLDGKDSAYKARLLMWQPGGNSGENPGEGLGDNLDVVVVENASYEGLTHRRAVLFVNKSFFLLVDDAIGEAAGDVDLHFQLTPGEMVLDAQALTARTDFSEGGNVLVQGLAQDGMVMQREEGQVSMVYSKKEARPAFRYRIRKESGVARVRFATLVVPYRGVVPVVMLQEVGSDGQDVDGVVEYQLRVDGFVGIAGYNLETGKAWLR